MWSFVSFFGGWEGCLVCSEREKNLFRWEYYFHLLFTKTFGHVPYKFSNDTLNQGSPTAGPRTTTSPWPIRNRAARQEMRSKQLGEASSVLTAAPHRSHYHLSSGSCQHYGELYTNFIISCNVIIIEIKCTIM